MAKIWDIPFANAGDKQTIPVPAQPDGTVSTTQGWTPDYELPNTNPSYKPVGREEMNGALFEITESIQQLQMQGAAEWSNLFPAYQKGAEVIHSGERWRSLINGNTEEPGTGSNWNNVEQLPISSTSSPGIVRLATIPESQAGSSSTIAMTPAGHAASTVYTKEFTSTPQVITNSGALTIAHGLGVPPKAIGANFQCVVASAGYLVGDVLIGPTNYDSPSSGNGFGVGIRWDATNIYVRFAQGGQGVVNNTTGAGTIIVNANFQYIVTAKA